MKASRILAWGVRFGIGLLAGIVLHYTLYRMSMPLQPFIYQAF